MRDEAIVDDLVLVAALGQEIRDESTSDNEHERVDLRLSIESKVFRALPAL